MSIHDQPPKIKQQMNFDSEELLALRKLLMKQSHPDKTPNADQKQLCEKSFKIIDNAFDAIENEGGWTAPYSNNYKVSISGFGKDGKFKTSNEVSAGTPLEFLNKVFRFLRPQKQTKILPPKSQRQMSKKILIKWLFLKT